MTDRAENIVLSKGKHFSIRFAVRSDGSCPASQAWSALTDKQKACFLVLFQRLCDHRLINDHTKFKKLEDALYEFKCNAHKLRIPCFFGQDGVVYLTSVFQKKEDDADPGEIRRAQNIRVEHLMRVRRT